MKYLCSLCKDTQSLTEPTTQVFVFLPWYADLCRRALKNGKEQEKLWETSLRYVEQINEAIKTQSSDESLACEMDVFCEMLQAHSEFSQEKMQTQLEKRTTQ